MKPMIEMSDEEREELADEAKAAIEAVNAGIESDTMACLSCGQPARVHRKPMAWIVECVCGWSAAGSGPPKKVN